MLAFLVLFALVHPESVLPLPHGRLLVSDIGQFNQDDGRLVIIQADTEQTVVEGLRDPKGLTRYGAWVFVTDVDRVWRIDTTSWKAEVYLSPSDFPEQPRFLNDVTAAPDGTLYLSDTFLEKIFRVSPEKDVTVLCDADRPNGVFVESDTLYFVTFTKPAVLYRVIQGKVEKLHEFAEADGGDGLWKVGDQFVVSGFQSGTVVTWRPGKGEKLLSGGLLTPADLAWDETDNQLIVPLLQVGKLKYLPFGHAGN